jgi:hypothetical protein
MPPFAQVVTGPGFLSSSHQLLASVITFRNKSQSIVGARSRSTVIVTSSEFGLSVISLLLLRAKPLRALPG